jgi:hypothetical protein
MGTFCGDRFGENQRSVLALACARTNGFDSPEQPVLLCSFN